MNIKDAAERSGRPAKTIRYYEDIGLIKPLREASGYRVFRDADVHKLAFLGRARALNFSIEDCRTLLSLWEDDSRASADVKAIAHEHLAVVDAKIGELQRMGETLDDLMEKCKGDDRPDGHIIDRFADDARRFP